MLSCCVYDFAPSRIKKARGSSVRRTVCPPLREVRIVRPDLAEVRFCLDTTRHADKSVGYLVSVTSTGGGATAADRSNTVDADVREVTPVRPDTLQSAWKHHIRCNPLPQPRRYSSWRTWTVGAVLGIQYDVESLDVRLSHAGDFIATKVTDTGNLVNHKNFLTSPIPPSTFLITIPYR